MRDPEPVSVNWALRARLEDETRQTHGWSYRTELIQILLLQEIRDELVKHNRRHGFWRRVWGSL